MEESREEEGYQEGIWMGPQLVGEGGRTQEHTNGSLWKHWSMFPGEKRGISKCGCSSYQATSTQKRRPLSLI